MGTYFSKEKLDLLKAQFDTAEYDAEQAEPAIYIGKEQLLDLMKVLRETPTYAFDRMSCLTAVDYKEYYEMVYCLYSRRYDLWVTVKVKLDQDKDDTLHVYKANELAAVPGWQSRVAQEPREAIRAYYSLE